MVTGSKPVTSSAASARSTFSRSSSGISTAPGPAPTSKAPGPAPTSKARPGADVQSARPGAAGRAERIPGEQVAPPPPGLLPLPCQVRMPLRHQPVGDRPGGGGLLQDQAAAGVEDGDQLAVHAGLVPPVVQAPAGHQAGGGRRVGRGGYRLVRARLEDDLPRVPPHRRVAQLAAVPPPPRPLGQPGRLGAGDREVGPDERLVPAGGLQRALQVGGGPGRGALR